MVGELRVANQENQKLERQLAEEQEQKDGLMITVRQRVLSVEGGAGAWITVKGRERRRKRRRGLIDNQQETEGH